MVRRRGLALLLVVGVLALMSTLAFSFSVLSRLERKSSQARVHATRAGLLARSGMEDALARLASGQDGAYGGENWDASPNGQLSAYEAAQEAFRPTGAGTPADLETCPVRHAMRPSFFVRLGVNPAVRAVGGRDRGLSGGLGGQAYALKVEDESAKIHVNGGFLDGQDRDLDAVPDHRDPDVRPSGIPGHAGWGWNFQLARILDVLGAQPEVGIPDLGSRALQLRPPGGWPSVDALEAALGTSADLSPFLTTFTWTDRKVVHPNAVSGDPPHPSLSDLKLSRGPLVPEEGGRAPVNLNAALRPVLVALLQGLQGREEYNENHVRTYTIPPDLAGRIADALLAYREGRDPGGIFSSAGLAPGPFRDWGDFRLFCEALVPVVVHGFEGSIFKKPLGGGNLAVLDLIQANFDPNSRLNKTLPDRLLWRWIDKSDLTAWSTEGLFSPGGAFRITCLARAADGSGRVLAEREGALDVRAFSLLRHTTQEDFTAGRPLRDYLGLASGGERTTGAAASWNDWWPGAGLAACSYPCPPSALPGKAAAFDGWLSLATTETPADDPSGGSLRFLHHFDDGWDADAGASPGRVAGPGTTPSDALLQTDPSESVWPSPPIEPNTLYPDGMHQQEFRSPAFPAQPVFPQSWTTGDTAPSDHGVFGYWFKASLRDSSLDSGNRQVHAQVLRIPAPLLTQAVMIGHSRDTFGILAENSVSSSDSRRERVSWKGYHGIDVRLPGIRWTLATFAFDTDRTAPGSELSVSLLSVVPGEPVDPLGIYNQSYDTAMGEALCDASARLVLGPCAPMAGMNGGARQVLDEFAVCDFGDDFPAASLAASAWASARFIEGRYYKGPGATFLSPAVVFPSEGRPLRMSWTEVLPQERRFEHISTLGNSAGIKARPQDPWLSAAGIRMEVLAGPASFECANGMRLDGVPQGFRYRATFLHGLSDPLNEPVLESPVLDDVTIAWQEGSGPQVLAWD